jgi:BirA family transcriptional regulator, biotin operon repressor / biotin---[acetyl-CoA-carboxylase] ligase
VIDSLEPDVVQPLLRGRFGRDYRYAERTASTQRLLEDAPEGAVAVAEEQTDGRGRLGRTWHARPGTSVLVSVLLMPVVPAARLPELTLVAGEACAEAIAAITGLKPAIKHPNDVLVDGRKVAGILAEAREGRVVLGIGINVNVTAEELTVGTPTPVGSLSLATGRKVSRAELLAELLLRLEQRYDAWTAGAR